MGETGNSDSSQSKTGDSDSQTHPSGFDLDNLSPEQQKLGNVFFAKGAEKKEGEVTALKKQLAENQRLLEDVRATATLSEQQKAAFEKHIEQMKSTLQTREQTLNEKLQDLQSKYTTETTDLRDKCEYWQGLHHDELVKTALTQAAAEQGAFSTAQVVGLLYDDCAVVEKKNETTGEVIGYGIEVHVNVKEGDKFVPKTLTVSEGVKEFLTQNPNLIKRQVMPGMDTKSFQGVRTGAGLLTRADLADPNNYDTPEKMRKMIEQVAQGEFIL